MAKLGVAQRLGIVLSIVWVIGAGTWQRVADVERGKRAYSLSLNYCYQLASRPGALVEHTPAEFLKRDCFNTGAAIHASYANLGDWRKILLIAVGPVAAAWMVALVIFAIGRWVLAGRN